jgi:hypothetical protein
MSSLLCPDGITYVHQVAEMLYMKETLDGVWFHIDEIFVALQLFYFQNQDGLEDKAIKNLKKVSKISPKLSRSPLPVLLNLTLDVKVQGCPQHCRHANGTWRFPLRTVKSAKIMFTDVVLDDADDVTGMVLPVTEDRVRALVTKMVKDHTCSSVFKDYAASARTLMTEARFQRGKDTEDIEEVPDDE